MLIYCRKCKKSFDPETQMAHCAPGYGHGPAAKSGQRLSVRALTTEEDSRKPKRKGFQSDFRMVWSEPDNDRKNH